MRGQNGNFDTWGNMAKSSSDFGGRGGFFLLDVHQLGQAKISHHCLQLRVQEDIGSLEGGGLGELEGDLGVGE